MTPSLVTHTPLAHLRWDGGPRVPVVLLHGVGGGRGAWVEAAGGCGPALAAAGHTVLAVDYPGYGLSAPITPLSLGAMAQALAATLAAAGLPRVILVGHSMGGMVAQEFAATLGQPGAGGAPPGLPALAGLVLAGTSPAFGKPGGDWQQAFLRDRFAPLDAGLGMAGLAAQLVPAMVAPDTPAPARAAAQAMMAAVPEPTYRAAVQALVSFDRRAALAQIGVPTLVITGAHDRTAPPEVARRMAEKIAGAQCVVLPGAGHLLNIEQPAAFHAALLPFLATLG